MTREEAIANLNMISVAFVEPVTKEQRKLIDDTFDMTRQALSQEPTEKPITVDEMEREYEKSKALFHKIVECDDAISRQAVLEMAYDMSEIDGEHFTEPCMVVDVEDIQKLPSVTQKSGKWIMSDDGLYRPICDKCGAHPWKGYIPTVEEATEVFKYCPNCGAKMESEDKE